MKKRLSIIISIIVLLGIIIGFTIALFRKVVYTQNVSFTMEGITVTYNAGPDISGIKLIPVSSLQKGLTDGTAIEKQITVSSSQTNYFNLYLDLEIIDNGLKRDYVKYQVNKGNNIVSSGNFNGLNAGDTIKLLDSEEINSTTSTYTLYIWIDGTVRNYEDVENQDYKFVLRATASDQAPVLASEKIISLSQGDTYTAGNGNGVYATNSYDDNGTTKYHEYRYVGGEPDNYVLFNNDLYQIIGVFDDYSHGVTGQQLVKLIAARKLIAAAWGAYNSSPDYTTYSSYKNDWTGTTTGVPASANILLNEYFLNPTATSTYGECINWTYGYSSNTLKSKNCSNIIGYGIQSNVLRNYIQPVTWYLYGYTGSGLSKRRFYQCERNKYSGCTSANSGAYSGTTTASIGLMYVSDYMYASGYIASDAMTEGTSYDIANLNWLYNGYDWTITPRGNTDTSVFFVSARGTINFNPSSNGGGLRPTFYLKSTIKIKAGTGTFENPYIIG